MTLIRKLTESDLDEFVRIATEAYPGTKLFSAEDRHKMKERLLDQMEDDRQSLYGAYRGKQLVGGMRCHDFTMNLFGKKILAGGVGMVAVDLRYKKEKICRDMIQLYLAHYRKMGAPIAVLWPFRPDFYRKMGFGYGAKISQYKIKPESIPKGNSKKHIRCFGKGYIPALTEFYNRYCLLRNGMIDETEIGFKKILERDDNQWLVGYEKNGRISGYINFGFAQAHEKSWLLNNMVIRELLFESREALQEILTFLNGQSDQIHNIVISVVDDDFHHVFLDPRNGTNNTIPSVYHESHTCGVGVMYRVLDTAGIWKVLADHNFNHQSFRAKFTINDSFVTANSRSIILDMDDGLVTAHTRGGYDFEVQIDISDFSSMLMGAITFEKLWQYGRAEISNKQAVLPISRAFLCDKKPLCLTAF